jgi:hypothetical protein
LTRICLLGSDQLDEFVEHCQAVTPLRPNEALRLWRQLGGRARTETFLALWHRTAERRADWKGTAA